MKTFYFTLTDEQIEAIEIHLVHLNDSFKEHHPDWKPHELYTLESYISDSLEFDTFDIPCNMDLEIKELTCQKEIEP